DGKLITYGHVVVQPGQPRHLEIVFIPFEGGPPVKTLPMPDFAVAGLGGIQWMPDGRALAFTGIRNNVPNVWALPLDGGPPRQLTTITSDFIRNYALSRDGRQLAVSRGLEINDIVLIRD